MITGSVQRAERVLATLDPADHVADPANRGTRAATLHTILTAERRQPARTPKSRSRTTRRLVLVGAALVLGISAVGVNAARPHPTPAYAATPPLLHYDLPPGAPAAADLLHRIAATARQSPATGTGGYGHISTKDWFLENPNVAQHGGDLRVDPSETQLWYGITDGSTRYTHRNPDSTSTAGPGTNTGYVCWTGRQKPPDICPVDGLTDRDTMVRTLGLLPGSISVNQTGRESALGAASDLAHHLVLPPAVRGELWDVLAGLPGITYAGRVTDRGGRTGEGFSLDFDAETGPVRDTLIVDPASGQLLSYERILLTLTNPNYFAPSAPGGKPLKIATPAVVDYSVFLASEVSPTDR